MPRSSRYAVPNKAVSQVMTLPAPTGGLNARDSLAMMQPNQAVVLENWFPMQYGVRIRRGYNVHVNNLPGHTETLITHAAATGTERMFAVCTDNKFYDVTASAIGGTRVAVAGPFSNARWQWSNMTNQFGSFTVACNGVDTPQFYDGTVWAPLVITSGDAGFDPKKFIHVTLAHRRLWFVVKDSGDSYYLDTDTIQGAATRFGVGELFPRGGFLQAIGTWSTESGSGMHDNTVFVSSEGDIAVFSGYDPQSIDTFTLAGTYRVGATFNRRCLRKYQSDLLLLSEDGVFGMSSILAQSKVLMATALSAIIQLRLSQDVTDFGALFGWEMLAVNRHQLLVINSPRAAPDSARQYVMNQITEAWCTFSGYPALCWGLLDNECYFGTPGAVMKGWSGNLDNLMPDVGGNTIVANCQQAYNYFGQSPLQKRWTMIRPSLTASGFPGMRASINVDFAITPTTEGQLTPIAQGADSQWDQAVWDDDVWSGGLQNIHNWYSVDKLGFCASTLLSAQSSFDTFWISTDFVFEQGAVL